MGIKVVKYDEKRWTVEMNAYGFTYHLVPTESKEEAIINMDAIKSFLTPWDSKESSDEMGDCNMPRVSGSLLSDEYIDSIFPITDYMPQRGKTYNAGKRLGAKWLLKKLLEQ